MLEAVLGPRFLPLGTAGICAPIERLEDGAGNRFGMGVPFVAARRFGYGTVAFVQVIAERKISNDGAARLSTELKTNESYVWDMLKVIENTSDGAYDAAWKWAQ